jgi:putative ABC transport system permease protein
MKADPMRRRGQTLLNASDRWFRLLLWLYPPDFRDEMGKALVATYHERTRDAYHRGSILGLASVWGAALWDSLRNGLAERLRPAASWRRAGDWGRDLERVSRRLARKPLFVIAMVGTLTVGLGTFAVVYTAVDKILLEPLPYPSPDDLYMVSRKGGGQITGPEVADLQKAGGMIEGAVALQTNPATIPAGEKTDAIRLRVVFTSWNLFEVLGVGPAIGRGFRPDDGPESPAVVLGDPLWKRLGGDPAIVGSKIPIGPYQFTVLGVMPPDFRFSGTWFNVPDLYMPIYVDFAAEPDDNHNFTTLIRARHGVLPEDVRQAVEAVGKFTDQRTGGGGKRMLDSVGFQEEMVNEVRPALLALSFAVVFLVLVLTVNLASLLLERAAEREREFAVSRALGASGPAVVRATLIEGGLLGLMGGIAGAWAGTWGTRLLVALGPPDLPRRDAIVLDWGVAAVVIAVGTLLGVVAAAVPAMWAGNFPQQVQIPEACGQCEV